MGQVTVLSTATMRDVRDAVSQQLGRRDVLTDDKIVQPQGHQPYLDSDLLGKRRRLLFIGPDFAENSKELPATFTLEEARRLLGRIKDACKQPDIQERAADPLL